MDKTPVYLGKVSKIIMGQSPSSAAYNTEKQGLPFLQGCAEFGDKYPTPAKYCSTPLKVGPKGSVLVSVRAPVGDINIADQDYVIGRGLAAISATGIKQDLLPYLLEFVRPELKRVAQGSTFEAISFDNLDRCPIPDLGDEKAQAKIAEVLSTIDRAIAQTEALMAKHQQVKTGLMQDLLTRGIDEHGQLRDSSTHRFKSTPLGMIPDEWKVKTVDELCYEVCVGIVIKPSQYYVENGVPALRSANIQPNSINLHNLVYISEESNRLLSKSMLREGYVVSVRTGYPGTSAVVPKELDGSNCIDLIISKPKSEILPKYLSTWVNSAFGKDQVLKSQGGLAQQHFNVGEMKNLVVCRPDEKEQERILKVLDAQDSLISDEQQRLRKLIQTKAGLMQDLLSGEVSVAPLLEN